MYIRNYLTLSISNINFNISPLLFILESLLITKQCVKFKKRIFCPCFYIASTLCSNLNFIAVIGFVICYKYKNNKKLNASSKKRLKFYEILQIEIAILNQLIIYIVKVVRRLWSLGRSSPNTQYWKKVQMFVFINFFIWCVNSSFYYL
jgi:hypothetical protein